VAAGGTGPDPGRRPVSTRTNGPTVWPLRTEADSGAPDQGCLAGPTCCAWSAMSGASRLIARSTTPTGRAASVTQSASTVASSPTRSDARLPALRDLPLRGPCAHVTACMISSRSAGDTIPTTTGSARGTCCAWADTTRPVVLAAGLPRASPSGSNQRGIWGHP
jgi:hypothetical protein